MKKVFYLDLLERLVWTFTQGAVAEWVVSASFDANTFKVAALAGAISLAKSFLATNFGDRNSAATLPSPPDYAVPPVEYDAEHLDI